MPKVLCFTLSLLIVKVKSDSKTCQWDCGTDGECYYGNPPGWQNKPYSLELHLYQLRHYAINDTTNSKITVFNKSDILSYINTEIIPLYEIYQQQISNIKEKFVTAMQKRLSNMKENAIETMRQIKYNYTIFSSSLNITKEHCEEEMLGIEVAAARHAAATHGCAQDGHAALAHLKAYARDLLALADTRLRNAVFAYAPSTPMRSEAFIRRVAGVAAGVLYELDVGGALARRHAARHLQRLIVCSSAARADTADSLERLRDLLIQCVYA